MATTMKTVGHVDEIKVTIKAITNGYLVLTGDEDHFCGSRMEVMQFMERKLPFLLKKLPDRKQSDI